MDRNARSAPLVRVLTAILLSSLLASQLGAQLAPERERGFKPEMAYQFNGLDSVNLMNGNPSMNIPLGSYPVAADVSYSFVLRYSGNIWEDRTVCIDAPKSPGCRENWHMLPDNAGLGWFLSFGRLAPAKRLYRYDSTDSSWKYTSPDGGEHYFYRTLHEPVCSGLPGVPPVIECDTIVTNVWYTRDSTYLRLRKLSDNDIVIEFPDGPRHRFHREGEDPEEWALRYIYGQSSQLDANGIPTTNFVRFDYTPSAHDFSLLTITDSHNRTHKVSMTAGENVEGLVIDWIELAAFARPGESAASAVARYELTYNNTESTVDGPSVPLPRPYETTLQAPPQLYACLLTRLDLPTGEVWKFQYDTPADTMTPRASSGAITRVTLPTGGRISWTYQDFTFSGFGSQTYANGVKERCMRTDDLPCAKSGEGETTIGNQVQYTEYVKADKKTIVDSYVRHGSGWGLDTRVENYFNREYSGYFGLPIDVDQKDADGRYLSSVTSDCDPASGGCSVDRKNYIEFEWDEHPSNCESMYPCERDRNRRVVSDKTVYASDGNRRAETNRRKFDGLGHYREIETTGNFEGVSTLTTFTSFNDKLRGFNASTWSGSTVGNYELDSNNKRKPGYVSPTPDDPWNLNTYSTSYVTDGAETHYQEACFSPLDGFLYRRRVKALKTGARSATDLLTVFTRASNGYVAREESFGGDKDQSVDPSAALCTLTPPNHNQYSFATDHTYEFGALKTSKPGGANFFSVNNTVIDRNTGLVQESKDSAGLATTWLYDRSGRTEKVSPPGIAATIYTYDRATDSSPARITMTTGSGALETRQVLEFDPFGRVTIEKRLMPDGTISGRKTEYDTAGRRVSVSEQESVPSSGPFEPQHKTIYSNFEVNGRPGAVTAPDGSQTTFAYAGERVLIRTSNVAKEGSPTEVPVSVQEIRDRHGRLITVVEDLTGTPAITRYEYDPAGHLTTVTIDGASQPPRTFAYDGRGLLTSEFHPESQTTTYKYDARGNVIEKTTPVATITNTYDFAGRLATVESGDETLKVFTYNRPNGTNDFALGKLDTATRYNYSAELGTVSIREKYIYGGPGGRVSKKETLVRYEAEPPATTPRDSFQFSTSYGYNVMGDLASLSYPTCDEGSCTSLAAPARTILNEYEHGLVTSIPGYTTSGFAGPGITYHPNGAVAEIRHQNVDGTAGPVYTQAIANGMTRPDSISVTGFCDDLTIDTHPQSKNVPAGSPAGLTVVAPNATTVQWFQVTGNTVSYVATGSELTIPVTTASTFFARVGNGTCTLDSNRATVTVGECAGPDATIATTATVTAGLIGIASVPDTPGATYAWTIEGGSITSAPNAREINFRGTGCSGTVTLTATVRTCTTTTATATVYTVPPRGAVTGSTTINAGGSAEIKATLFGAGPWTVTWSDGVVQGPFTQNVVTRIVDPTITTSYSITALQDGAGCAGTSTGAAVVTVTSEPTNCGTASFSVTPWELFSTIMPNEATTLTATLASTGASSELTRRYHFRWYQDEVLAQDNDQVYPNVDNSQFTVRFTGQTVVRLDGWVSCHNAGGTKVSETAVVSATSLGLMWDHCPTFTVKVAPKEAVLDPLGTTLKSDLPRYPYMTYQWYAGESGNTYAELDGQNGPNLVVTEPGTYWLRVTTDCGTISDSATITVASANGCTPVRITQDPQEAFVAAGTAVPLSVSATSTPLPTYFIWETPEGNVPDSRSRTITVRPVKTTDYAARVGNDCSMVFSKAARIHVTSCADITIISQPVDVSIAEGQVATLSINATAVDQLQYRWYMGESGDTTSPITGAAGSGPTLQLLDPVSAKYWVRLSFLDPNKCQVDSRTVMVNVCREPAVHNPLHTEFVSTVPRQRQVPQIGVTGDNLTYQWFEGVEGDESKPLSSTSSAVAVYPEVTTRYWVKVTSECAPPYDDAVIVRSTRVSVCPIFDGEPTASKTIVNSGETVTLSVDVDRGDVVEWFKQIGTATPVSIGFGATITSPAITETTRFFVKATSGSCTKQNDSVTVALCDRLNILWSPQNKRQVERDELQTLSATFTDGGTANFDWYSGPAPGDLANSTRIHSGSNAFNVHPLETTSYWLRVTRPDTGCYTDSTLFTVNVCVPKILTQPQSTMIDSGQSVPLGVGVDLDGMTYRWYIGQPGDTSNPVPNGTAASITVSPTQDTTYWVRVTGCNAAGLTPVNRDSAAATVSVCKPPEITQHPQNVNLTGGGTTIGVTATGTELAYQWYRGLSGDVSNIITGATGSTYTVYPTVTTNYWVKVTGRCGSTNSNTAKVSLPPTIDVQPVAGPITKGATRQLSVSASGTELRYEWYQRIGATPSLITGATGSTYTPPAVNADTTYFVRVYSGNTWRDSADATFTVCLARAVDAVGYPNSISGSSVTLQVVNPAADETFEWYQGASGVTTTPLGGGTQKVVAPDVTTTYWARTIRNGCTADSAVYTRRVCIPRITVQPVGGEVNPNATKTLTVTATGTATLTYQWYKGASGDISAPLNGATSASYTVPANTASASYWVRVRTGETTGCSTNSTDSNAATVTLCEPPSITTQPVNKLLPTSGPATLEVWASGTNLSYQWYSGPVGTTANPLPNGTGRTADVQPSVTTNYWVRITGNCGTKDSNAVKVSVKPVIQSQPAGGVATKGESKTLSVTASGTELSYQWYQRSGTSSTLLGGAVNPTYATGALLVSSTYYCKVTSGEASIDTNDATFTVCEPRSIRRIGYGTQRSGDAVTLEIVDPAASGESYQWYIGTPGTTTQYVGAGPQITVRPTGTTTYWARTVRTGCNADSEALTITICYPKIDSQPQSQGTISGTGVTLSVAATGTGTLAYQWYRGQPGDTSSPVTGATSATYNTDPAAPTTYYWVRVSAPQSGCGSYSTDSSAALVTVCQRPVITEHPRSTTILKTGNAELVVVATDAVSYQWYRGNSGDTSSPVGDNTDRLAVYGTSGTRAFWVRVTNSCGTADSNTALVSVYPTITEHPVNACGSTFTMYVKATGADSFNWYRKYQNVTTLIGTGPQITVTVPGVPVYYWAEAISGEAATKSYMVSISSIQTPPTVNSFTATAGTYGRYTLQATVASGDVGRVGYRFYRGPVGDTTYLLADSTTNNTVVTPATKPQKYWVRVYYLSGTCFTDRELTIQ